MVVRALAQLCTVSLPFEVGAQVNGSAAWLSRVALLAGGFDRKYRLICRYTMQWDVMLVWFWGRVAGDTHSSGSSCTQPPARLCRERHRLPAAGKCAARGCDGNARAIARAGKRDKKSAGRAGAGCISQRPAAGAAQRGAAADVRRWCRAPDDCRRLRADGSDAAVACDAAAVAPSTRLSVSAGPLHRRAVHPVHPSGLLPLRLPRPLRHLTALGRSQSSRS